MMTMDNPASINTVMRNFLPAMFAVCNIILFSVEMPVPTLIATVVLVLLFLALCVHRPRRAPQPAGAGPHHQPPAAPCSTASCAAR